MAVAMSEPRAAITVVVVDVAVAIVVVVVAVVLVCKASKRAFLCCVCLPFSS